MNCFFVFWDKKGIFYMWYGVGNSMFLVDLNQSMLLEVVRIVKIV